ncbi:Eco47II family restriction endonuclease [Aedoeadaptatus coxii]|uniref:Eco47II family restriction endonuclease n=1 Tax=Aedoeadaptatus coxii TaxID=755172 RepID=UPI002AD56BB3|nr:Eco47II family restriction endonuclease [Peptoniphilus coxii]
MDWDLDFISKKDFKHHVENTIVQYGRKLQSFDVKRFNANLIDPIKMIFDKAVYNEDWETVISSEIFRQRDKSNTNEIGYFHQRLFDYIDHCRVPNNGEEGGWDIIFEAPNGYQLEDGGKVSKIFVEMKNKHNTMNSASSTKTYMKMQNQLLSDDDCVCFLVEVIAKKSQNIKWETTVDQQKVSHKRIRRVSVDKFYEIVTGEHDAFYKMCMALPGVAKEVIEENQVVNIPSDTVYEEIKKVAKMFPDSEDDMGMILSMYMLGFSTYNAFHAIANSIDKAK